MLKSRRGMSYEAEPILADRVHRPTEFSPMYTCDFDTVLLYFAS